jgi:hypothetical protein
MVPTIMSKKLFLFIYTLSKFFEGEYHLVNIVFASSLALVGA